MTETRDDSGKPHHWSIDITALLHSPAPRTVLFELLRPFGFNNAQVEQTLQSVQHQPGSFFVSGNYRLLVDRSHLIIEEHKVRDEHFYVNEIDDKMTLEIPGGKLAFKAMENRVAAFPATEKIAFLDADKLHWPLTLRHWSPGDWFKPLGMHGQRKKLQDFFSNSKLSRSEKEKVWIMESEGKICWIVGMRIDERFKVTTETVRYLVVEFLPTNFAP